MIHKAEGDLELDRTLLLAAKVQLLQAAFADINIGKNWSVYYWLGACMPQLPHSIELHDSELSGIERKGRDIHLLFSPAYIHRDGKGWTQEVEIIVREATLEPSRLTLPATVDDGTMHTRLGPYHNLLNIPFAVDGPVKIELELMSGEKVTIEGNGIEHEFKSEAVFVEQYPST